VKIVVLCPHFEPDTAPTGVVMTRIVHELAGRGHELHVVTSLPWYRSHRIEPEWSGRWATREWTTWGSVIRVHPFPGDDKSNVPRRAVGFAGFSVLAGLSALRTGGVFRRADVVLAMSPPLSLGLTGWLVGAVRGAPLVFNVQDIFPDAAVRTGAIRGRRLIAAAYWLERVTYRRAAAVTVLSDDLRRNVAAKIDAGRVAAVRLIPNFVDTEAIRPLPRMTAYRSELGIGDEPVVLYAGNVGFSQSLDLVMQAAQRLPDVTFLVNGDGAARAELERRAASVPNMRFAGYQPAARLAEVLATGDVHVVPLRAGLGDVSVPSKAYSSLAAGRPIVASIDLDSEIPRLLAESGAGLAVAPGDVDAFVAALRAVLDDPVRAQSMAAAGREWAEREASPAAVGAAYERLLQEVAVAARHRLMVRSPR
jgi:colanic acid biosynthesis glycosyl transferase WcaI